VNVEVSIQGACAEIVLNRPEKLNAISAAMVKELHQCLDQAQGVQPRALVLRGEGPAFCAGRDLTEADPGREDAQMILREIVNPLILRIADFPAPTFAAVQGACLGVGLGLAFACDVVYAAEDAKIGSPFARIGAVLDSGGHAFFVSRLGAHRALELIYTGRLLSGVEAQAWGLVNRSVKREALLDEVRALAAAVAKGPTRAFMESKRIVRQIEDQHPELSAILDLEAAAQGEAGRTADYKEGITAFQQKRAPQFIGR
jgi:2-(1,2-epoxy-1,2-dihydrophenyl)acetyl-CoA isomerase